MNFTSCVYLEWAVLGMIHFYSMLEKGNNPLIYIIGIPLICLFLIYLSYEERNQNE